MTAPATNESEPTLAEAFTDLAEGIANAEEHGGDLGFQQQSPTEQTAEDREVAQERLQERLQPGQEPAGGQRAAAAEAEKGGQPAAAQPAAVGEPADEPDAAAEQPPAPETQPLTYTVNGEQRTFEGGFHVPGQGVIITNEAMPRLLDRLQQADRLVGQNQQLYAASQEYQKLGGRAAFEKMAANNAMLDASASLLLRALNDQNTLVSLATDPVARQQLIKELTLTGREAQLQATAQTRETIERETAQETLAQQTQTAIYNAVGAIAQQYQGLTAEDIQAVRSHAGRMHAAIVRPATPAEAQQANVQVGSPIIDIPLLQALLQDRHALRQSAVVAAQRRQTDAQDNAARAAAAAPTRVAPNGKVPPPRPGPGMPSSEKKKVDQMSYTELTRAMRSGRIIDMLDEEDAQNQ